MLKMKGRTSSTIGSSSIYNRVKIILVKTESFAYLFGTKECLGRAQATKA